MPAYYQTRNEGMLRVLPMLMRQRQMEEARALREQQIQRQYMQMMLQERARMENARRLQEALGERQRAAGARELLGERVLNARLMEMMQRQMLMNQPPKPKPGYATDPRDPEKQVPIPGGPAWRELSSKHATDYSALQSLEGQAKDATDRLDRILSPKNKAAFESNFGGYNAYLTQFLPGETQNTRAEIEALKAAMKSAGLGLMRAGGSVGAITQQEWPIMERLIDNVTPLLSEDAARTTLQRVGVRLQRLAENAKQAYKTEWGDSPFYKETTAPAAAPTGVDPKIWGVMTPEEKALWQK